eukprot:g14221.t1
MLVVHSRRVVVKDTRRKGRATSHLPRPSCWHARIRANPGNGNDSRRFGTTLGSNAGGASSQGGASSGFGGASSSSRRYTIPASNRAGKRPSSRGGSNRNQRARASYGQENDVDPIEDAVSLVEVPNDQLLSVNMPHARAGSTISVVGPGGPSNTGGGRIKGEGVAVNSVMHQMLLLCSDFRTDADWANTVTQESSAVLKAGYLLNAHAKGTKNFREFAVAIKKNLKMALSVLHKGERRVAVNPAKKKLELSETALKATLSRARYADEEGQAPSLTQVFKCSPELHYDTVLLPLMNDVLVVGAASLAEEVEKARLASAGNDHESSDEEGDPTGFSAATHLRNVCNNFKKVPRGGQSPEHLTQLNK